MYEHTIEILNKYAAKLLALYKSNLAANGHNASGRLASTASYTIETLSGSIKVTLHLEDYYKYIEDGRRPGRFPPPDAILRWIKAKRIMPREINGKLPTENQLAFLIGRKIANEGIKGTHDLKNAQDVARAEFENQIRAALQLDFNSESLKYMQNAGLLTNLIL